jgi:hypothetical protein
MIQKPEQVQKKMVAVSFLQFTRYYSKVIPIPQKYSTRSSLSSAMNGLILLCCRIFHLSLNLAQAGLMTLSIWATTSPLTTSEADNEIFVATGFDPQSEYTCVESDRRD